MQPPSHLPDCSDLVGLIVPHMARRMAGNDMRVLIPFCCLCGGSLVVLSDLAARTLFMPAELPAGILMAALGAPFFLWLLLRKGANAVIICYGISLYRGKKQILSDTRLTARIGEITVLIGKKRQRQDLASPLYCRCI